MTGKDCFAPWQCTSHLLIFKDAFPAGYGQSLALVKNKTHDQGRRYRGGRGGLGPPTFQIGGAQIFLLVVREIQYHLISRTRATLGYTATSLSAALPRQRIVVMPRSHETKRSLLSCGLIMCNLGPHPHSLTFRT